jgi:hypothetical protein
VDRTDITTVGLRSVDQALLSIDRSLPLACLLASTGASSADASAPHMGQNLRTLE